MQAFDSFMSQCLSFMPEVCSTNHASHVEVIVFENQVGLIYASKLNPSRGGARLVDGGLLILKSSQIALRFVT